MFTWALEEAALNAGPTTNWQDLFRVAESKVAFATFGAQIPQLEGKGKRVSVLSK